MSLLPHDATFEELVEDCFLAFRGFGVMLSPLDAELVSQWAALHVPIEVVARGIRRAAEKALWDARPGESGLRSLRACRVQVDAEIRKYLSRAAGRGAAGSEETSPKSPPEDGPAGEPVERIRHRKMRAALRKFASTCPSFAGVVEKLLAGLLGVHPRDFTEASQREELILAALLRALPFGERVPLLRQARAAMGAGLSPRARKLSWRFHRGALLRQKIQLPAFW